MIHGSGFNASVTPAPRTFLHTTIETNLTLKSESTLLREQSRELRRHAELRRESPPRTCWLHPDVVATR